MTNLGTLVVDVVVKDTQARRGMERVRKSTVKAGTQFRVLASVLRAVGGQFASATIYAAGLSVGLIGLAVAVGGLIFGMKALIQWSFKAFSSFEEGLGRAAIAADRITEDSFARLGEAIADIAKKTQFTAAEMATAAKVWLQAGRSQEDFAKGGSEAVANLAAIAEIKPDAAVKATVRMMEQFGAGVGHLERFNDVLAAVSTSTTATVTDLNSALKFFGTTAAATNMTFEESLATLGRLRGVAEPNMAARGLDVAMRKIINPTRKARDAIEAMGLSVEELAEKNILEVANEFAKAGASFEDMTKIFSARAGRVMGSLVNIQKSGKPVEALVASLDHRINGLAGAMTKVANLSLEKRVLILKSQFFDLGRAIGERAAPAFRAFITAVEGLLKALSKKAVLDAIGAIVTGVIRMGTAFVLNLTAAINKLVEFKDEIKGLFDLVGMLGTVFMGPVTAALLSLTDTRNKVELLEREEIQKLKDAQAELDKIKEKIEAVQFEADEVGDEFGMWPGDLDDFEGMEDWHAKMSEHAKKEREAAEARARAEEATKRAIESQLKSLNEMIEKYRILLALKGEPSGVASEIIDFAKDFDVVLNSPKAKKAAGMLAQHIANKMSNEIADMDINSKNLEPEFNFEELRKEMAVLSKMLPPVVAEGLIKPLVSNFGALEEEQKKALAANRDALRAAEERKKAEQDAKKAEQDAKKAEKDAAKAAKKAARDAIKAHEKAARAAEEAVRRIADLFGSLVSGLASGSSASIIGAVGSALAGLAGPLGPAIDAVVQLGIKFYEMAGILDEIDAVLGEFLQYMADMVRQISGPWISATLGIVRSWMVLIQVMTQASPVFGMLITSMKVLATAITYLNRPFLLLARTVLDIAGWLTSFGDLWENDVSKQIKKASRDLTRTMREQDRATVEMWVGTRETVSSMKAFRDSISGGSLEDLERRRQELITTTTILSTMGKLSRKHIDTIHKMLVAIDEEIEERNKATESLKEFNEEVNNLPSGYKRLKMRQLQVTRGELGPNTGPARPVTGDGIWRDVSRRESLGGRPSFDTLRRFNGIFAGATGEQ